MTTGARFANITNKANLGFQDFKNRFLDYLRTLGEDVTKAQWSLDGFFDVKLTLTSGTDDAVSVSGSSRGTDGIGHILDPAQSAYLTDVPFENSLGETYYVALKYALQPFGVRVNPRTGAPEYGAWEEVIGESADPTSVTNNGATITFNVNSVTESGRNNAGRTVVVFKKTPALGATVESVAIEILTVDYSAPNNTVTTSGLLGQTTVSTDAADYTVMLLGPSIKRDTLLSSTSGYAFVGTVIGVGSSSTPVAFDNSDQTLIKTFQDASQITFLPYLWATATNLQNAIEQVVDAINLLPVPQQTFLVLEGDLVAGEWSPPLGDWKRCEIITVNSGASGGAGGGQTLLGPAGEDGGITTVTTGNGYVIANYKPASGGSGGLSAGDAGGGNLASGGNGGDGSNGGGGGGPGNIVSSVGGVGGVGDDDGENGGTAEDRDTSPKPGANGGRSPVITTTPSGIGGTASTGGTRGGGGGGGANGFIVPETAAILGGNAPSVAAHTRATPGRGLGAGGPGGLGNQNSGGGVNAGGGGGGGGSGRRARSSFHSTVGLFPLQVSIDPPGAAISGESSNRDSGAGAVGGVLVILW